MGDGGTPGEDPSRGAGPSTAAGWFGALVDLAVPLECGGCGRPRERWCAECARAFGGTPFSVRTRADLPVPAWALARHVDAPARAVSAYKDRGRTDLAAPFGAALAAGLDALRAAGEVPEAVERPTVLVPAPASARARRRRGVDHVRAVVDVLAAALAASPAGGRVCVAPVLEVRGRVRDAAGLDARARARNLEGRIRRRPAGTPLVATPGAPPTVDAVLRTVSTVLLVDDVLTTGATAAACVAALRGGGLEVDGVLSLTSA